MTERGERRPRLGFVGIHAGRRPDQAVSQNEAVAALFSDAGYLVRMASTVRRPMLRTVHHVIAILAWRRVDVLVVAVFSGRSFLMADLATILGRLTGKTLLLFLHGGNLPHFSRRRRRWVGRVLRRADAVVAPSAYLARAFPAGEWGFEVTIVPNVLSIEWYHFRPRDDPRPNLLWMRTFHEHYDPLLAVEVLAQVRRRFPDARLTMAGADQGLLESVRRRVAEAGLGDAVAFPGYLGAGAKRRALEDHDVLLHTNVVDNMPVTILEAAACGVLIVATGVGGIPDLLTDGHDAIVVPPGDAAALAAGVGRLLADPDTAARTSMNARALAERFSWEAVRPRWEELFARLGAGPGQP